ncbi:MAG: helix-turn-helix domain-containing protein [Bdellovibrionota bacterium]
MSEEGKLTLGQFLRQERERRSVSIEQVSAATKISVRILDAIEGDRYRELPAKPFVRGFVGAYCRFIGLDSKEVLITFGDFMDSKAGERPVLDSGHSGYAFERRETEQSHVALWVVMASFLFIGTATIYFLRPSLIKQKSSHLEKLRAAHIVKSPSPVGNPVSPIMVMPSLSPLPDFPVLPLPSLSPIALASPVVSSAPLLVVSTEDPLNSGLDLKKEEIHHKVIFKAIDDVWVRYKVDDKKQMKFILRKDRVLVLRGREAIRFQASDPSRVSLSYGGQFGKLMTDESSAVTLNGDLTLFFPSQLAETIKDPFPGTRSIFSADIPPSANRDSLPTQRQ